MLLRRAAMCLIVFSWRPEHTTRLVLLANRDEFYERPTEAMGWWQTQPDLLAGRDLRGGGTWLGVTRQGRFAALTNFRDGRAPKPPADAPSRGVLVTGFLDARQQPMSYLREIEHQGAAYAGFNLLAADFAAGELAWYGNRAAHGPVPVEPGMHALSNALLDTPWPKTEHRRQALHEALQNEASDDELLALMRDSARADPALLPDTGVAAAWEQMLSAAFIAEPTYGTRCTTLLKVMADGEVRVTEVVYDGGDSARRDFDFRIS